MDDCLMLEFSDADLPPSPPFPLSPAELFATTQETARTEPAVADHMEPQLAQAFDDVMAGRERPEGGGTKADIPIARIKSLMKRDGDVAMISCEAPHIMSKASALFITDLTYRAFSVANAQERRTIRCEDVSRAARSAEPFDFLYDLIADAQRARMSPNLS